MFPIPSALIAEQLDTLLADVTMSAVRELLVPRALVVTPNVHEAARLAGMGDVNDEADMSKAASAIRALG